MFFSGMGGRAHPAVPTLHGLLDKSIVHTRFLFFISDKLSLISDSLKVPLVRVDRQFSH